MTYPTIMNSDHADSRLEQIEVERKAYASLEQTTEAALPRINIDRDWCISMAKLDGDQEIGAGLVALDPTGCPHCEYDRRFHGFEGGGWIEQDNNGPIVPCPVCNPNGARPRQDR